MAAKYGSSPGWPNSNRPSRTAVRPNMGFKQVRFIGELRPLQNLKIHSSLPNGLSGRIILTSRPYKKDGTWWVRGLYKPSKTTSGVLLSNNSWEKEVSLEDKGVIPDRNGLWATTHWLEHSSFLQAMFSKMFPAYPHSTD